MAAFTAIAGAAVGLIGGAVQANQAKKAAGRASNDAARARASMNRIRNSRQAITNPYAGVVDLSHLAKDLSNMVSNPFSSLGVATQAAEIKMEQADIALANTFFADGARVISKPTMVSGDWKKFIPGVKPGGIAASKLNPICWPANNKK